MELGIIQMNGDTVNLNVDNNATVGDLKHLISQILDFNPPQQRLSANIGGQRLNLDDDFKTLSSYNLRSGSNVMLLIAIAMQVFVKNDNGKMRTYDVDAGETVDDLQRKIFNIEGTPADQQRLIYEGKQLEPGKMLQDYNITSGSTIYKTLCLRGGE